MALFYVLMLATMASMVASALWLARLFLARKVPFVVVQVGSIAVALAATAVIMGLRTWLLGDPFWS